MPARERHVLVTGAAGAVGSAVCRLLSDRPEVRTVMAVDADEPTGSLGRARPVRLDVRDPRLGALVRDEQVDTVVHAQVVGGDGLDPRLAHDVDVIGTIQVLAACAAAGVERVVIRSGTAVYGAGADAPALWREERPRAQHARRGHERDLAEIEAYAADHATRHPDACVTVLRVAPVVGPQPATPLARYLSAPVITSSLGFNPRLQVIHEDDAAAALAHAALAGVPGTFNVAGEGTVRLHRLAQLLGRRRLPVPGPLLGLVTPLIGPGAVAVPRALRRELRHGRGTDVRAAASTLGFRPRYSTEEALRAVLLHPSEGVPVTS